MPTLKGDDGVTPHIGANNHWYIGETDTGITAEGKDGAPGQDGQPGKSAYQYAQDGGYTGTEAEFAQKLSVEYHMDVQINGESIVGEDGVADISKLLDETLTHNTKAAPAGVVGELKGDIGDLTDLDFDAADIVDAVNKAYNHGSSANTYTLPMASTSVLGGVKVGNGLSIDDSGVLFVSLNSAEGVSF